jgi:hypothetical protein
MLKVALGRARLCGWEWIDVLRGTSARALTDSPRESQRRTVVA